MLHMTGFESLCIKPGKLKEWVFPQKQYKFLNYNGRAKYIWINCNNKE